SAADFARRRCGSCTSQTAATRTSENDLKIFSRPVPIPPTPMKPRTIDSLAGAADWAPTGFLSSAAARAPRAPVPAAPTPRPPRCVHFPISQPPTYRRSGLINLCSRSLDTRAAGRSQEPRSLSLTRVRSSVARQISIHLDRPGVDPSLQVDDLSRVAVRQPL